MATINRLKSGNWRVQIRRKNCSPITKTFTYRRDAEAFAAGVEHDILVGRYLDPRDDTPALKELLTRYREQITPTKKGAAQEGRRVDMWIERFGELPANQLTPELLASWRDERLKVNAPATVRLDLAVISHLFTIAVKESVSYTHLTLPTIA